MFRSTFHSVSLVLDRSRLELPAWSTGLRKNGSSVRLASNEWPPPFSDGIRRMTFSEIQMPDSIQKVFVISKSGIQWQCVKDAECEMSARCIFQI